MIYAALAAMLAVGVVVGWLLRGAHEVGRRGVSMIDLSRQAARGELDLDWTDPRMSPVRPVTLEQEVAHAVSTYMRISDDLAQPVNT